jgi:hypothetical protein
MPNLISQANEMTGRQYFPDTESLAMMIYYPTLLEMVQKPFKYLDYVNVHPKVF